MRLEGDAVTPAAAQNRLMSVRSEAVGLASTFFDGAPVDMAQLWRLCAFFEGFLLAGADGTRAEFGPKVEQAALRVVK